MKVLVTGGGGFLGSNLAHKLLERGDEVWIIGRKKYSHLHPDIHAIQGDLRNREVVFSACRDKEVVFHSAAFPGIWGDKQEFYSINVDATQNVIDACLKHSIKKLIFTSSPSVVYNNQDMENVNESAPYPETYLCEYPRTKAIAERMVLQANGKNGLLTVALRPHLIWGPGDPHLIPRLVQRARQKQLLRVGQGRNKVDVIFIDNAVQAHLLACEALEPDSPVAGKCYFINDDEPVNLWNWIGELLTRLEIEPPKKSISYKTAYCLGAVLETVYRLLRLPDEPRMTRFLASTLATSHYYDSSSARRDFNYRTVVSPEEGLKRLVEHLRSRQAC